MITIFASVRVAKAENSAGLKKVGGGEKKKEKRKKKYPAWHPPLCVHVRGARAQAQNGIICWLFTSSGGRMVLT